jgi:hypothetical protein
VARPLLESTDEGQAIRITGALVGAQGERWIDPFLAANADALRRLNLRVDVQSRAGLHMLLSPSGRIGAVPLVAPATRRVIAGVLVRPRFRWTALGEVVTATGFAHPPVLGGGPLVPGSARGVPAWLVAGPVVSRIEAMLARRRSTFSETHEVRTSPRGRVDWGHWARRHVPSGQWTALPCEFSDLGDDPDLMATVRWTLRRLVDDLSPYASSGPGRVLTERIRALQLDVGPGDARRPVSTLASSTTPPLVAEALQAMSWVADERGVGGGHALDGLSWSLEVAEVWEAWVRAFSKNLAPRIGLRMPRVGQERWPLRWEGRVSSMNTLAPDVGLHGNGRVVWLDAKYKAHLSLIARHGWSGATETLREAHRADLHQALAYAALADVDRVDTVLLYPHLGSVETPPPSAVARVVSGRRRVRLILGALPFGFGTPARAEAALREWHEVLAA